MIRSWSKQYVLCILYSHLLQLLIYAVFLSAPVDLYARQQQRIAEELANNQTDEAGETRDAAIAASEHTKEGNEDTGAEKMQSETYPV